MMVLHYFLKKRGDDHEEDSPSAPVVQNTPTDWMMLKYADYRYYYYCLLYAILLPPAIWNK